MRRQRLFLAVVLILLGAALLLGQLNADVPDWNVLWPVLPLAGGIALLVRYASGRRRNPGYVFLGTAAVLTGLFYFSITLGPLAYGDLSTWWPVFVLVAGVAFLAQWSAARFRDRRPLFLALVALVAGGAELAANLEWVGGDLGERLLGLWPAALLVLAGVVILARGLAGRRR